MVCAGCKNLDAKKKSDGKNGGSLYYCKKMKKYIRASDEIACRCSCIRSCSRSRSLRGGKRTPRRNRSIRGCCRRACGPPYSVPRRRTAAADRRPCGRCGTRLAGHRGNRPASCCRRPFRARCVRRPLRAMRDMRRCSRCGGCDT